MINVTGRKVLLDTNLLLLLLIGSIDQHQLGNNRRVRKYGLREFTLLNECLRPARALLTTEHINSQTSDLGASSLNGAYRTQFLLALRAIHDPLATHTLPAHEYHQPILMLDLMALQRIGVADAGAKIGRAHV